MMMRIFSFISAIFLSTGLMAQTQHVVEVDSEIDEVVVSSNTAQVNRHASVTLQEGVNRLIFHGNYSNSYLNALQVKVGDGLYILGVSDQMNEDIGPRKKAIIKMIKDSISSIEYSIAKEQNYRYVLEMQESLLLANKELKGYDKGLILIDLEDALLIYHKQLSSIKQGQLDSKLREENYKERLTRFEEQLEDFSFTRGVKNYSIIVLVSAPKPMKDVTVRISYVVESVGWKPMYDIRVKDIKSPVMLKYKAEVYNGSGEDWNNVKLVLTSKDAGVGGKLPELAPNRVDLKLEAPKPSKKLNEGSRIVGTGQLPGNYVTNVNYDDYVSGFYFEILARLTIINKADYSQIIDLVEYDLNGEFQYFSIPKLDQQTYLLTKVFGWESLKLLPGAADIYYENVYITNTDLDPRITADTLNISLGKDKGVVIQRKQLTDFSSSSIVSGKKRQVFAYEITVRNTKKEAIEIRIEDQIPLSMNKEITVTPINLADASVEEESGKLTWIKTVQPNETIVIRFEYELRYPKDRVISGL